MAEARKLSPQQVLEIVIAKLQSMTPLQVMVQEFETEEDTWVISIEVEYEPD